MIRLKPVSSGKRAEDYYGKTDGGYYHQDSGLRCRWVGSGAPKLGLTGPPTFEQFKNLIHGLDPHSGDQLTARLRDNRIPAWDMTASVPKGVTEAIEGGDERAHDAVWRVLNATVSKVESYASTRVRVDGRQEDRVTGNLVGYAVEHPDTRPVEDETLPENHKWRVMPQMDRHIHVVIANLTNDDVEDRWKAVKFRPIMDLRKFFDRTFDSLLAAELVNLGYEIETKEKEDGKGRSKYFTWDIKDMPESLLAKRSKRSEEIDQLEQQIVGERKKKDRYAPDHLSAREKDMLGGTSRRLKRDDLTLEECREYWRSQETEEETAGVASVIQRAREGRNPRPEPSAARAVDFAMRHHFEQQSTLPVEELAITAMEHAIGGASPEEIDREMKRQGVIIIERDGKRHATTKALMREEQELAGFALGGRGTVQAVGVADGLARQLLTGETLNAGQWDAVLGLLRSENRVEAVLGPAGAGKSKMLRKYDEGMKLAGQNVTYLGSTSAAVKVLRKDGFDDTQTVARFLLDTKMQEAAKGGRVVVDETSILGHADAVKLFGLAKKLDLKLIFIGDAMQHGSIGRGNLLKLLQEYGRVKPFRLTEILRQKDPRYREVAQLLSEGRTTDGFEALDKLGGVREIGHGQDRYTHLAADYVQSLEDGIKWDELLMIAPTHREAGHITAEVRSQLRAAGRLGQEDHQFDRLVQVDSTVAERGQASAYRAGDIIEFHQNGKGGFVKGRRYVIDDPAKVPTGEAAKFSLYRKEAIALAEGDVIRFTGTVHTLGKDRVIRNGDAHTVAGFTDAGNIKLDNGDVISANAGHFRHGFVETSVGSQGRTVRRVLLGMAAASGRAINMQQLYVSASRASEWVRLYTDSKEEILEAIQRDSQKPLALDLKAAEEAAKRKEEAERERLRIEDLTRRNYGLASEWTVNERKRLSRNGGRPQPPPTRPMPPTPPRPMPPTHAGKVRDQKRQRENSHGR